MRIRGERFKEENQQKVSGRGRMLPSLSGYVGSREVKPGGSSLAKVSGM